MLYLDLKTYNDQPSIYNFDFLCIFSFQLDIEIAEAKMAQKTLNSHEMKKEIQMS